MTKKTSRDYILDAFEMMQNLVALCSHAQEIINVGNVDYENEIDEWNKEEAGVIMASIDVWRDILEDALQQRREIQKKLFEEGDGDHKSWCAFKHALANHGYAVEVWYANMDNEDGNFWYIQMQRAYETMIQVASIFLWVDEITICGRCLVDKLRWNDIQGEEPTKGSTKEVLKG